MSKLILGMDPDMKGALAFFDLDTNIMEVIDMPTVKEKRIAVGIDPYGLLSIVEERQPIEVWIEYQQASSAMGVSSAFKHGQNFGEILGLFAALKTPVIEVPASKWKNRLGLDNRGGKNMSIYRATKLMPQMADYWPTLRYHGRAEAALIAVYAALVGHNVVALSVTPDSRMNLTNEEIMILEQRELEDDENLFLNDAAKPEESRRRKNANFDRR